MAKFVVTYPWSSPYDKVTSVKPGKTLPLVFC